MANISEKIREAIPRWLERVERKNQCQRSTAWLVLNQSGVVDPTIRARPGRHWHDKNEPKVTNNLYSLLNDKLINTALHHSVQSTYC